MIGQSVRCRVFIGRRDELAALEGARKALAKSCGSFMLISGEAGIGKTRLLTEFLGLAHNRRARHVVNTECLQSAQQPLGPIRALMRSLVSAVSLTGLPPAALRALVQVVPEELAPEVVFRYRDFVLEKEQLFSALLAFLRHVCARRATILTVEDLHWSDASTLEFLGYVANRMDAMRLLIVATCRSDELERNEPLLASMSQLFRGRSVRRVMLEPFVSRDIRAVVEGTLDGRDALPEDVARDIERLSEGNPFFAEELVKDFIERAGGSRIGAQLPLSIRASIAQRLTGLADDERTILECAAVLGQRFDPSVLAVVMERDVGSLAPALRHAYHLNLLVDVGQGRLSCRFRHALTRQTIYDGVPRFAARKLHSRILSTLEAQSEADSYIEELAYHAWEAGDMAKAARYNERAGDAAFLLRAIPEGLLCYRRALEAASELDDRARILERIGALERSLGHSAPARNALEAALAIRLERNEIDASTLLVASIVGQRYNLGDQGALADAEQFLDRHRSAMSAAARDNLLVICARVASAFFDFPAAERFLDAVSDPATLAPRIRQNYLIVQLMRYSYAGNVAEWKRNAEAVEQLLAQLAPESVVSVEAALAMTGVFIGANEHVERALERVERVEREWGFRGQRLYAVAIKGAYLYQRGRLAEARACVEEVIRHQDFHPARRVAAAAGAHLATALGDHALWNSFDAEVLREARSQLHDPDCLFILAAHAGILAATGALSEAQADLRAATGALAYSAPEALYVLLNAARYLPIDETARVRELAEAAAQSGCEAARANLALVRATIAMRSGEPPDARTLGEAAAEGYAALGWPLLEARALELAGKVPLARAIYERCGASAELRRLAGPAERPTTDALDLLSSRESEVAALVARGLRNTEIAKRLNIGKKTVEKHLASVFDKLGLRSRAQVVALIATAQRKQG